MSSSNTSDNKFTSVMLDWYDKHRRVLPWRAGPDDKPNPYHVWLSEIMLQQTTVPAVIPYFLKFIERWPDVESLASADNEEIMSAWAGLGYYARARNMHKCAWVIVDEYGGKFPDGQNELIKLPGIGDYTSAAIASIAFDKFANVVDGNIERVIARYHAIDTPLPQAKKEIKETAKLYTNALIERPGDYAQSLMDLGASVCRPRSPICGSCPLTKDCKARALERVEDYPKRLPKKARPQKYGLVYWVSDGEKVLVHKRPSKGLLGGLYGLPTSSWEEELDAIEIVDFVAGLQNTKDFETDKFVTHIFTHFSLKLYVHVVKNQPNLKVPDDYKWVHKNSLDNIGFPSVFEKVRKIMK